MAGCSPADLACVGGAVVADAVSPILDGIVKSLLEGVSQVFVTVSTMWTTVRVPQLTGGGGGGPSAAAAAGSDGFLQLLSYVSYVASGVCLASLMLVGALMAVRTRRGDGHGHLGRVAAVVFALLLISAAYPLIRVLMPAPSGGDAVGYIQSATSWYAAGLAGVSVVIAGARMAWTHRGEAGLDLLRALMTLLLVGGGGVTVVWVLTQAADGFSDLVLGGTTSARFGANLTGMFALSTLTGLNSSVLVLLIGIVLLFLSLVQVVLMVVRSAMLVVLTGVLPLSASFTTTQSGRQWFTRSTGWLLAFILYKPAAAIVYATAFKLMGSNVFTDGSGLMKVITGAALMAMALVALPALMRFIVPFVGAIGSTGGAGVALAGAAGSVAGTAIATGAIRSGASGSSSGSGGGSGAAPAGPQSSGGTGGGPSTGPGPSAPAGAGAAAGGAAAAGAASSAGAAGAAGGVGATGAAGAGAAVAAGPAAPVVLGVQAGLRVGGAAVGAVQRGVNDAATSTT